MKMRRSFILLIIMCSVAAGIYFRPFIRLFGYKMYYLKIKKFDEQKAEKIVTELYTKQKYEESAALSQRLLLVFPQNLAIQKIRGLSLFMMGKHLDGAKYLLPLIRTSKTDEQMIRHISQTLFEERYFSDVVNLLEGIPLGKDPELNYYMGSSLVEIERYREAIVYLEKSEARGSNNANVYYYLGRAYEKLGNEIAAINNYRQTLKINPFHNEAKKLLIALYARKGLYTEAERALKGRF